MASMTLTEVKERLAAYLAAEVSILKSQSYTIKDRTLTRADLRYVQAEIRRLQTLVDQMEAGGSARVRRVIPRDI